MISKLICSPPYHSTTHLLYLLCINVYVYNFAFYSSCLLCCSFDCLSYQKNNSLKVNFISYLSWYPTPQGSQNIT